MGLAIDIRPFTYTLTSGAAAPWTPRQRDIYVVVDELLPIYELLLKDLIILFMRGKLVISR